MQNRVDITFTKENRDTALEHLRAIQTLMPFLIDLTPEERMSLTKMGNSGKPFVDEALNLVEQDDSLCRAISTKRKCEKTRIFTKRYIRF